MQLAAAVAADSDQRELVVCAHLRAVTRRVPEVHRRGVPDRGPALRWARHAEERSRSCASPPSRAARNAATELPPASSDSFSDCRWRQAAGAPAVIASLSS